MGDIPDAPVNPLKRKRKSVHVSFADEEDVINPEDIDPSIGRFRNMVQTTVIAPKVFNNCDVMSCGIFFISPCSGLLQIENGIQPP